jgi:hypothetical protein
VLGQNVILSPNGQFPLKDKSIPFMVVGLSVTEDLIIEDQKEFAELRIKKVPSVKNITIQQSTPTTIGLLTGYTTLAEGKSEDTSKQTTVYQVVLFDSSGYCIMIGITPSAKKGEYLPIFKKVAKSFRMKSQSSKAVDGYVAEKEPKSDSQLSQLIIGKWKSELVEDGFELKGTSTYTATGKVIVKAEVKSGDQKYHIDVEKNWFIENGVIFTTVTKSNIQELFPNGSILKDTIIRLDNKVLKYRDQDGGVNTVFRLAS